MRRFDAIIVGCGAMGSAAAYQLAKRGSKVLGLDRFAPPHAHGSSHGETRITRLAIGEGVHYTPLALRSHELWEEMERGTGARLLTKVGALIISSAARTSFTHVEAFFENTLAAARAYGIDHEMLGADEIRRRYPALNIADDELGYFEKDAGFLRPEACLYTQLLLARQHGAEIHRGERALGFESSSKEVIVTTDKAVYGTERLVLSAGPWLPDLIGRRLAGYFRVYRQLLFWFDVESTASMFAPERFPVFIWQLKGKPQAIYGFPAVDGPLGGVKVGSERLAETTTAADLARTVDDREIAAMHQDYVAPYLRGVGPRCLKAMICLYTVSPDFGFIVDDHPDCERVLIVSPCSGHGFKHSAAIGEAVAERLIDGSSRLDLSAFSLDRFAAAPA